LNFYGNTKFTWIKSSTLVVAVMLDEPQTTGGRNKAAMRRIDTLGMSIERLPIRNADTEENIKGTPTP
jgi:hypothetical protein